jgi:hypothetical protein
VVEALNLAKRNKTVRSGRSYDANAGDWLRNALSPNALLPFHAIIAAENPEAHDKVIQVAELDEQQPLMAAPQDSVIRRDAPTLVGAMRLLLQSASRSTTPSPHSAALILRLMVAPTCQ